MHMGHLVVGLHKENEALSNQLKEVKDQLTLLQNSSTSNQKVIELQDKLISRVRQVTFLEQDLQSQHQLLQTKEEEKRVLDSKIQILESRLRMETDLKVKAVSYANSKSSLLAHVSVSPRVSTDIAQELASRDFALLQYQEKMKEKDIYVDSLLKDLENLKVDLQTSQGKNHQLQLELQTYKADEEGRWEQKRLKYLNSPDFGKEFARRMIEILHCSASGVYQQLKEGGYLPQEPPPNFINFIQLNKDLPDDLLGPFM